MTKMTNGDVRALIECLDELANANMTIPVRTLYTMTYNRAKLISKDKLIEKTRLQLVEKYGEKDDKGVTMVKEENMQIFQKDWLELLSTEIEVELRKIKLDELEESLGKMQTVNNIYLFFEALVDGEIDEPKAEEKVMEVVEESE